jgi:hypothetical protein
MFSKCTPDLFLTALDWGKQAANSDSTVKRAAMDLVPSLIGMDFVSEGILWAGDLSDLILIVDEISSFSALKSFF